MNMLKNGKNQFQKKKLKKGEKKKKNCKKN